MGKTVKDFEKYTDEELIVQLRNGEEKITEFMMNKYKNLVRSKAQSMYILGADNEDLIQEGMIGLFKALRDYQSEKEASFYTFAELCISRQMYTALQASGRQKHLPLNSYISLYGNMNAYGGNSESEDAALVNAIASKEDKNPEEVLIDKENVEALEQIIEQELSAFEKQVLDLFLTGMSYSQIAKVLGKTDKTTDNALQRIRNKLRIAFKRI